MYSANSNSNMFSEKDMPYCEAPHISSALIYDNSVCARFGTGVKSSPSIVDIGTCSLCSMMQPD